MMNKSKKIVAFILLALTVCVFPQKMSCAEQKAELQKEISNLEDLRRGLESAAIKFENQAQRLQFESNQMVEAKRYWHMAEQNRESVKEVDKQIETKKGELEKLERQCP